VASGAKDFCQTQVSAVPGVSADTFPKLAARSNQSRRIIFLAAFKRLEAYRGEGRKSLAVCGGFGG
jgi:hypothetical protein